MKQIHWLILVASILMLVLLVGCAPAAAPSISVESAWGRPSATMPTAGGMFMVIKNSGTASDKLLSGSSPACGSIEVHEMVKKDDGTMGMNLVDKPLEITPGGQVELKPGALHIMCIMKKDDQFKVGAKIDLTLKFEKAGEKTVSAEIHAE
jgi:periplasmic copper chaperone A